MQTKHNFEATTEFDADVRADQREPRPHMHNPCELRLDLHRADAACFQHPGAETLDRRILPATAALPVQRHKINTLRAGHAQSTRELGHGQRRARLSSSEGCLVDVGHLLMRAGAGIGEENSSRATEHVDFAPKQTRKAWPTT